MDGGSKGNKKRVNAVSIGNSTFKVRGLVNNLEPDIILDTGVEVTVVLESFVTLNPVIDDGVNICGLRGNSYVARLAKVNFVMQS